MEIHAGSCWKKSFSVVIQLISILAKLLFTEILSDVLGILVGYRRDRWEIYVNENIFYEYKYILPQVEEINFASPKFKRFGSYFSRKIRYPVMEIKISMKNKRKFYSGLKCERTGNTFSYKYVWTTNILKRFCRHTIPSIKHMIRAHSMHAGEHLITGSTQYKCLSRE